MHKIMKIISATSLALIYSIGAVSALSKVKESKVVEAADSTEDIRLCGSWTAAGSWAPASSSLKFTKFSTKEEYYIYDVEIPANAESKPVVWNSSTSTFDWWGSANAKVTNAGTYNVYFEKKGSSDWENSSGNKHLYFEVAKTYTIDVKRSGSVIFSNIATERNPADDTEFYTSENVEVKAGDELVLKINGTVDTTFKAESSANNNCYVDGTSNKFKFDANDKIYIKTGDKKIFAGGLESGFGMVIDNATYVSLTQSTSTITGATEYYVKDYVFTSGNNIKFVNTSSSVTTPTVFYDDLALNAEGFNTYFTVGTTGIDVSGEVTANLYLSLKSDNSSGKNVVYIESTGYKEAVEFAQAFETKFGFSSTATSGVCNHDGSTEISAIQTAWQEMSEKYTDVTDETAKKVLKGEITSSHTAITTFAQGYDYIYGKYSSDLASYGGDFAGRNPTSLTNTSYPRVVNLTSDNNIAIVVVILIGSVSLIAAGSFLVIRKNKRQ